MPVQVDRDHVSALARGLRILACFTPDDIVLGNGDISRRTDLPKATVARLTYTLCNLGYLIQLSKPANTSSVPAYFHWAIRCLPSMVRSPGGADRTMIAAG